MPQAASTLLYLHFKNTLVHTGFPEVLGMLLNAPQFSGKLWKQCPRNQKSLNDWALSVSTTSESNRKKKKITCDTDPAVFPPPCISMQQLSGKKTIYFLFTAPCACLLHVNGHFHCKIKTYLYLCHSKQSTSLQPRPGFCWSARGTKRKTQMSNMAAGGDVTSHERQTAKEQSLRCVSHMLRFWVKCQGVNSQ